MQIFFAKLVDLLGLSDFGKCHLFLTNGFSLIFMIFLENFLYQRLIDMCLVIAGKFCIFKKGSNFSLGHLND